MRSQEKCTLKADLNHKSVDLNMSKFQDKRLKFQKGKQRELLESVIRNEFKHLKDFVEFVGYSRKNVFGWRKEKILLPKSIFKKICKAFPEYNHFEIFIFEELPENWILEKGRNIQKLRIKKIKNKIKKSIATLDTKTLKRYLEAIEHRKSRNKRLILKQINNLNPKSKLLDSSKISYSWKDSVKGIILPKEISTDLCYVIGAHIGDGSMNIYRRPGQVDYYYNCTGHQINDRKWYDNVLIPLKKKLFNLDLKDQKHQ